MLTFKTSYKLYLQKKILLRQFPTCFKESKSIFTHIPKAAGMSIGKSLYNYEVGHVPITVYKKILGKQFDQYFKFTFSRDPIERFISAYEFLKQGGMTTYSHDLKFKQSVIDKYSDINDFIENWINHRSIYDYIHFVPQNYFICDKNDNILVDFIGKIENIEDDYQYICDKLNISNELNFINKTKEKDTIELNNSSKNKLLDIYKKDFILLDYKI